MIDVFILGFFILLSIVLLIVGFFKEQYGLIIFSGILFMLVGYFFMQGISYSNGVLINETSENVTVISDTYDTYTDSLFKPAFSFSFILLGAGLLSVGVYKLVSKRETPYEVEENE